MNANKIKALIVDDESHARLIIRSLLGRVAPDVEVVAEAENLMEASRLIQSLDPDLVFMDIEMPGASGLEIRKYVTGEFNFALVFVTAYDQYAIQAMRLSAIDYLLKPLDLNELKDCLERVRERMTAKQDLSERLRMLEENRNAGNTSRIVIQTLQDTHYLSLDDLEYLEADGMYTVFWMREGRILASKPVKVYEEALPANFFRIHRSYIVNLKFVSQLSQQDRGLVVLDTGKVLPLARTRRDEFLKALEG